MPQNNPHFGRLAPRLMFQLVPAVIVSAIGIILLGSVGKTPDPAPAAAPAETAIEGQAVFRIVPRETASAAIERADDADARRVKAAAPRPAKPKTTAAKEPVQQPHNVATAEPTIPAPLEPPAAAPQPGAAPAPPSGGNFITTGWRRVTAAAERLTQWVQPPSEWFERSPPPRPPAPIPERNFVNVAL